MSTTRIFFAIMLPKSAHDVLSGVLKSLKQSIPENCIRWTNVENLHVTLQFLKSIRSEDLILLIEQVRATLKNTATFQLKLGELEWFPTPLQPKIISLAVEPQEFLISLSASIGQAISGLNYPVESLLFRGHLSLGRLKNYNPAPELLTQIEMPIIAPILINEIYLMESKPTQVGSNYYPLAQFKMPII